jgi:hypothetical protein
VTEPWSWRQEYGNVADVVGLVLTAIGFIVTWVKQRSLRNETVAAQREARRVVETFVERLAVADFTALCSLAQELRHLMAAGAWDRAADRSERLRNLLVQMVLSRHLTPDEKDFLRGAADDANLVLQAVEALRNGGAEAGALPPAMRKKVDTMLGKVDALIMRLSAIDGRLRNAHLQEARDA